MTDLITRVKAALKSATLRPWRKDYDSDGIFTGEIKGPVFTVYEDYCVADWVADFNSDLIALAPDMARALIAAEEHLVARLKRLRTYFDLSDEELEAMTPNERADCIRQHRLICEALRAFSEATKGGEG
jgi:hypothetical protein